MAGQSCIRVLAAVNSSPQSCDHGVHVQPCEEEFERFCNWMGLLDGTINSNAAGPSKSGPLPSAHMHEINEIGNLARAAEAQGGQIQGMLQMVCSR